VTTLSEGLVTYFDYVVRARAKLLDWVRQVSPSVYTQPFSVGHGCIRATLLRVGERRGHRTGDPAEQPVHR
jgi:uncharacterized damage-inducible protein DinB